LYLVLDKMARTERKRRKKDPAPPEKEKKIKVAPDHQASTATQERPLENHLWLQRVSGKRGKLDRGKPVRCTPEIGESRNKTKGIAESGKERRRYSFEIRGDGYKEYTGTPTRRGYWGVERKRGGGGGHGFWGLWFLRERAHVIQ